MAQSTRQAAASAVRLVRRKGGRLGRTATFWFTALAEKEYGSVSISVFCQHGMPIAFATVRSDGRTNARQRTEKEKDMKRTVSLLTAALFAGALAAPVFAQSPAMEASPAAAASMAAPSSEASTAGSSHHHTKHHWRRHRRHHASSSAASPSSEASPSGGEASPGQ
jgi:hypothetical protein